MTYTETEFLLENWVYELIAQESRTAGISHEPDVVIGAAMMHYCRLNLEDKVAAIKSFRNRQVEECFNPQA